MASSLAGWPGAPVSSCYGCVRSSASPTRPRCATPVTGGPTSCSSRELARRRPGDAVLSEEGADDPAPADRRPGLDRRPARRHPRVRRGRAAPTGPCTSRSGSDGEARRPARSALPAQGAVLATDRPPALPPTRPARTGARIAVSRTRPPALPAAVADELGAELVPMGSAGAKIAAVLQRRGRRLRARRRPVRVGLGRAGRCGACRRAARLPDRRSPLSYNQADPRLPDLLVCRPELAERLLAASPATRADAATEARCVDDRPTYQLSHLERSRPRASSSCARWSPSSSGRCCCSPAARTRS